MRAVLVLALVLSAHSPAAERIALRYVVQADPFQVDLTLPNGKRTTAHPRREAGHFFVKGNGRWPDPGGPDATPVHCEIDWQGFPSSWRLVNSFGLDRRKQAFDTTLGELRKAVFAGGDFRIRKSRNGLLLATRAQWKFSDPAITSLLDRIAEAGTAVWRDRGLAGQIVYFLATDESAGHWQGEGRTRATIFEASRHTAAVEDLAQGLAHELFHAWNPQRLNSQGDERLYWFTEGVTEYYALIILGRLGIWDFERVLDNFNTAARQYFGSPARNLTAARMVAQRQADGNAERLPYTQGLLLAAHWNTHAGALDQAMRHLIRHHREPLSNRRIADALEKAGIPNARSEIDRFITRGETIALRPGLWGKCAVESKHPVRQFEMGFDLAPSRQSMIIQGVIEGSNAWQAGVRNGQRWTPTDVVWGDPGYLAQLEIRDAQGARRVQYYPASAEAVPAPQYTAVPGRACAATNW